MLSWTWITCCPKNNLDLDLVTPLYINFFLSHNYLWIFWKVWGNLCCIFGYVWLEGIIFKLKCNRVSGNLVNFFENYLSNWYQHVFKNGKESDWVCLKTGVPQGSVLGPYFFSRKSPKKRPDNRGMDNRGTDNRGSTVYQLQDNPLQNILEYI